MRGTQLLAEKVVTENENTGLKAIKIPDACIRRISIYYRTLNLLDKKGVKTVTSVELAEIDGRYPALVRKDLSYFGCFGLRGTGYDVSKLKTELARILGLDRSWGVAVIGNAGYGGILKSSWTLKSNNFSINKVYDKNPEIYKNISDDTPVYHIDRLEDTLDPEQENIAIMALPPPEVQDVLDRLSKIGLKAALYLASRPVKVPDNMVVMNQDVTIELGMMTYYLNKKDNY